MSDFMITIMSSLAVAARIYATTDVVINVILAVIIYVMKAVMIAIMISVMIAIKIDGCLKSCHVKVAFIGADILAIL